MRLRRAKAGFTLTELLMAAGVFSALTLVMVLFMSTSVRLIIRNLATNHSHDTMRASSLRMVADLHDSASRFTLVTFDGTTYSDAACSATADPDLLTGKYISTRANGVRFCKLAGGPFRLCANAAAKDTELQFDFGSAVAGALPYTPQPGDRFVLPLVAREYRVASVLTTPSAASPLARVRMDRSVGFRLSTGAGLTTTAYFYRKCAYTVFDGELRYHANFEGGSRSTYTVVRGDITSPKPFALLFNSSGGASSDQLKLRISMETADKQYSSRQLMATTTTLQVDVPPRTFPLQIQNTN